MQTWDQKQPIYQQLADVLAAQLLDGEPPEGQAMPSVRALAGRYLLNPLTVNRALQALGDEGLLENRRGLGLFVTPGARDRLKAAERERFLQTECDGQPVITIFTGPPDSVLLMAKRLIDIGIASLALVLSAPMMLLATIAIRLDSRGPAVFTQERVGFSRRPFKFYKFRTMVLDAEARQADLESLNEAQGPVFKIRNDPRITRVGRLIRRLSIDELPQLFNVLTGDMSIVGPRPLPARDVARIDVLAHRRRFTIKPGITCLWQVSSRAPSFDDWIKTDMEYIDNWSLGLDFQIMMKTIPAVLSGRGAC